MSDERMLRGHLRCAQHSAKILHRSFEDDGRPSGFMREVELTNKGTGETHQEIRSPL